MKSFFRFLSALRAPGGSFDPKAQKSQFEKSPIAVAGGDLNWSAKKRAKLQKAAASE